MAGLLADIFSAGDTAKRKLRGLLGDPVGTVTQFVNNENDRAGRLKELTYEAAMERRQRVKGGDLFGMGPKETQLTGLLADAYNPIGMTSVKGPQAQALETARKNAVKMLGLAENNTPMDRAKALGFDTDLLHGTDKQLTKFDANRAITKDHGWYGDEGVYLTPDPSTASAYSNWKNVGAGPGGKIGNDLYGQNVMPLMVRRGNVFDYGDAPPIMDREKAQEFSETVKRLGFDTVEVPNKYAAPEYAKNYETVVLDPSRIRSRFAAFDPARVNENDLLGRADPALLGLLGLGVGGGAYLMNDK